MLATDAIRVRQVARSVEVPEKLPPVPNPSSRQALEEQVVEKKRTLERAVQFLSAVTAVCAVFSDPDVRAVGGAVRAVLAVLSCLRCARVGRAWRVLVAVVGVASAVHAEPFVAPPVPFEPAS